LATGPVVPTAPGPAGQTPGVPSVPPGAAAPAPPPFRAVFGGSR
jgi:hypothetical protein